MPLLHFALFALTLAQSDSPDLRCILDRVPAASRPAILDEAIAGGDGSGPGLRSIVDAAGACGQRRSWDSSQAAGLAALAFATLSGEEASDRMAGGGLDSRLVAQWFDAQDVAVRTDPNFSEATIDALFAHLRSGGVAQSVIEAQAETIGAFFAALVVVERVGAGLPIE